MNKSHLRFAILVLMLSRLVSAQEQKSTTQEKKSGPVDKGVDYLLNYLNMAGTMKASDFRPLTQHERTHLYFKTMVNPLGYIKAGLSAGIDQWNDKPAEWRRLPLSPNSFTTPIVMPKLTAPSPAECWLGGCQFSLVTMMESLLP